MQKIIWNSKVYIIHNLGGYTKEEYKIPSIAVHNKAYDKGFACGFEHGCNYLAKQLYSLSNEIYGCSKQEWINKIYSEIKKTYEQR